MPAADPKPLLRPGETCWRIETASRAAFLIDGAAFFSAAKAAMRKARRSIMLLGWDFDPRTRLEPDTASAPDRDTIGAFLLCLREERPELDIRLLIWDMTLALSARHAFYPQRAQRLFEGKINFHLDDNVPFGASHHQKALIIDDEVAFCGGGDFAPNRWDSSSHPDESPFRVLPTGRPYPPRHELMMIMEGPAARALGDLARERWRRAMGETLETGATDVQSSPWPDHVVSDLKETAVAIIRTEPARDGRPAVRENERLYLEAIAAARDVIFLENQYFTSSRIGAALAVRLNEPDGPEIVVICSRHSPGFSDWAAMDSARDALIAQLRRADRFGRFHAYAPHTRGGKVIIVHSKVAVIDDRLLRIGSANLNNRSLGYDTECDLAIEADGGSGGERTRQAIVRFRNHLIGHYLGHAAEQVTEAVDQLGNLAAAIEALDSSDSRRVRPFPERELGPLRSLVAKGHLGDPMDVADAWRPWKRPSEPMQGSAMDLWPHAGDEPKQS